MTFCALVAVARAGDLSGLAYSAPLAYGNPSYAVQKTVVSGNVGHYAQPSVAVAYNQPQVHYSQPAVQYAQPITKLAAPLAYAQPLAKVAVDSYDPNPQYKFSYDVQDSLTGDSKSQYEHRDGDVVKGSYSLIDADGSKRTVDYTADPVHGFNAVVHREPLAVKAVQKAIVAAPVVQYAQQPQYIQKSIVSAPVVQYAQQPQYIQKSIVSAPAVQYAQPQLIQKSYVSAPAVQYHQAQPIIQKSIVAGPTLAYQPAYQQAAYHH